MSRIIPVIIAAVVVAVTVVGGRYFLMQGGGDDGQACSDPICNDFTLTDHTGKPVTDEDFRGKYMLVYFGYTFCPDVCPTSLAIVGDALDMLSEEELAKLTPVFITVDPERDTVEVMASYVVNFHDQLVGLTGTPEQVKAAAKGYRAYYAKTNADDPDGNYLMDHSSFTYLMGPDGRYVTHFNHGTAPEKMAARLAEIL